MSDLRQAIELSIQEANVSDENEDFTLAASIYRQELVELEQTIKICTVIQDTGLNSILEAIQAEEQREARDRDMAFHSSPLAVARFKLVQHISNKHCRKQS